MEQAISFCMLRAIREGQRRTQLWLGEQIGSNQSFISNLENGLIEPNQDEAEKIAQALGTITSLIFPELGRGDRS